MGNPRLIILVRHAQSEANKNRAIHQTTPDHKVKLTPEGHSQASAAGVKLLSMLQPDDTLQIYTSPYLRTRETTQGMLAELKSHPNYDSIKVYEEPRLREQDFGNFQPCAAEMERIWHERSAYGHFFYRMPNGESAADAYDRISGFNESIWRQFAEPNFPSVLVLVTHGLMTRIFLMKWYHYSVEYFEDLRNVNHCEFVVMQRNDRTGKYVLESKLRTWSELRKEKEEQRRIEVADNITPLPDPPQLQPVRRWGGCVNGCNHAQYKWFTTNGLNENGNSTGDLSLANFQARLQERLGILQSGRDFGGSDSGAASDCEDSGSVEDEIYPSKAEKSSENCKEIMTTNSLKQSRTEAPCAETLRKNTTASVIVEKSPKSTYLHAGQPAHYIFVTSLLFILASIIIYMGGPSIRDLAEAVQQSGYKGFYDIFSSAAHILGGSRVL